MWRKHHLLASFLVIGLVLFSGYGYSETKKPFLEAKTYRVLTAVHALIAQQQYTDALDRLAVLLESSKLKSYDHALVQQTRGIIYQELAQYQQAIIAFKEAFSSNMLSATINHQLLYQLAQLLISEAAYQEGLSYLKRWFTAEPQPMPESHILAAISHYHLKQYRQLIQHAEQAIAKKKRAPLMWYELLLAGYYATDEHKKAIPLLIEIITKEPDKKQFWLQLINSYQRIKDTKKAAATYTLAYQKKLLDEDDILHLAHYYLYQGMPYRAGILLQREMDQHRLTSSSDHLKLLANSWLLAREDDRAEAILLKLAAASNSTAYLQLGQLYIARHDWQQTYTLLKPLIETPDKGRATEIDLYFGIAALNMKRYTESQAALQRALSDQRTKTLAKWWLDHPDMQKEKRGRTNG